jgi:iron(III) transport system ATP-binding protein
MDDDRSTQSAGKRPAGNDPEVLVKVVDVSKVYGRRKGAVHALTELSLDVRRGEFLVLLGPSGCGKTTLLRSIAGLLEPTAGRIELHGDVVFDADTGAWLPPNRRDIGMVFQQYALWPHMTVERNVAFPLRARGLKDDLRDGRVAEVLELVQCSQYAKRYPPELSGGQQQRIALARALAARPAVMLMDEPLSNLDALLRIDLRAELRRVHEELRFTSVYVTHDQVEAMSLATRLVVMRAGRIEQVGSPDEVYRRPATEYVAEFLGARTRLSLVTSHDGTATLDQQPVGRFGPGFPPGVTAAVRVRPAALELRSAGTAPVLEGSTAWLRGGRLLANLPGGDRTEHLVALGDTHHTVEAPAGRYDFAPGDDVEVGIDAFRAHFYRSDSELPMADREPTPARELFDVSTTESSTEGDVTSAARASDST